MRLSGKRTRGSTGPLLTGAFLAGAPAYALAPRGFGKVRPTKRGCEPAREAKDRLRVVEAPGPRWGCNEPPSTWDAA